MFVRRTIAGDGTIAEHITVRIPSVQLDRVDAIAESAKRNRSEIVREAVDEYLVREGRTERRGQRQRLAPATLVPPKAIVLRESSPADDD